MNVLVTGGAGYIGSHNVKLLLEQGHRVVVVDNLCRGHRAAVPAEARFVKLSLADTELLTELLRETQTDVVLHFAAYAYVGESMAHPLMYYQNNVGGTISLLQAMQTADVSRLVFSSTCATYGIPAALPIVETTPQQPINPYGQSKLIVERMLHDLVTADPKFGFLALRYFNAAGCARDGTLGEDHNPEPHLIPLALQTALGQRSQMTIFGTNYDTPDGTCIRDYIHVEDLATAHLTALEHVTPGESRFYNLGIGRGYSVKEVLAATETVTGKTIPIQFGERRPGDPPILVANADRFQKETGWQPRYTDLKEIIATAWEWFRNHPRGCEE